MISAPILETPRLVLRAHEPGDLDACVAMWAEPEVVRYTVGTPSSPQRTWLRMLGYRGHWSMLGFGYWAVIERASGTFVGELGFADFKRDVPDDLRGLPEIGWAFANRAWGKGYATEGVRAAHRLGRRALRGQPHRVPGESRERRFRQRRAKVWLPRAGAHHPRRRRRRRLRARPWVEPGPVQC